MSCGVGHRRSSDPALLRLCLGTPCAASAPLKDKKTKKKKEQLQMHLKQVKYRASQQTEDIKKKKMEILEIEMTITGGSHCSSVD